MPLNGLVEKNNDYTHWYPPAKSAIESKMRDNEDDNEISAELDPQEEEALLRGEDVPPREKFDDITEICLRDIFAQQLFAEGEMERLFADRDRCRANGLAFEDIESELVIRNMRLVVSVARHYLWRCAHLSLMDLIQEGSTGLMKAVQKFEVRRGYKFSTYAWQWVRQKITRFIVDTDATIRLPVHVADKVTRVVRARTQLMDMREIADIPVGDIAERAGLTSEEAATALNATKIARPISLATPAGEENGTVQDLLFDEDNVDTLSFLMDEERADAVAKALASLPEREERILRMRYGIGDGKTMTLEEVGQVFHLTRERIRQIQVKAERHFRHHFKMRLRSYS